MYKRQALIQEGSVAEVVAQNIYEEILKYQYSLPEKDDVAISVVHFGMSTTILVDSIGYIGYNLIRFGGKDSSGTVSYTHLDVYKRQAYLNGTDN